MKRGFGVAYLIYVLILCLVSTVLLVLLWFRLADYQRKLDGDKNSVFEPLRVENFDERGPQEAFMSYIDGRDAGWWTETYTAAAEEAGEPLLETPRQIQDHFEKLFRAGAPRYYKDENWNGKKPVYLVRIGDDGTACAHVSLGLSGDVWQVTDVRIEAAGYCSGEIEVPQGTPVCCARTPLGEEYITERGRDHIPFDGYEELLQNPVTWNVYRVEGLLEEPLLTVDEEDGASLSETDGCIVRHAAEDDQTKALTERAEAFIRAYVSMMAGGNEGADGRLAQCLSYVRQDSEAARVLKEAKQSIYTSVNYSGLTVEFPAEDPFIRWADNCMSTDITYHAYAGQEDYSREDQHLRILFLDRGSGYEICAFRIL
ncbi:MAG: hypothetical protein IKO80_06775 [Lachnospiraceae bacterium]|nr:hypothetical protein [Lachnospiraceae bacterium]